MKDAHILIWVSIPFSKSGVLLLGTIPGMKSEKHEITNHYSPPTMSPGVDFAQKKPDHRTHFAIYTAGVAIGYEPQPTIGHNYRAENKADWFTPEVLRAARVFLKELSTGQYANVRHTAVTKPGFTYFPSELNRLPDEGSKGRWVHPVSLGLQVAQITWRATRLLPFYVRGLLRAVPIGLFPEVCTIAALTDSEIEVIMDHRLMLWICIRPAGSQAYGAKARCYSSLIVHKRQRNSPHRRLIAGHFPLFFRVPRGTIAQMLRNSYIRN